MSVTHTVERKADWHIKLADAVAAAGPGDKIRVQTGAMLELAVIALQRQNKHEMGICVEVYTEPTANGADVFTHLQPDVVQLEADKNVAAATERLLQLLPDELPAPQHIHQEMHRHAESKPHEPMSRFLDLPPMENPNNGTEEFRKEIDDFTTLGRVTHTTTKPTEEQIAAHQKAHGIKPSDLLPPYSPNDPLHFGLGKYRRYLPKTPNPPAPVDRTPVHPPPVQSGVADVVSAALGKPGVPNANGDVMTMEGWKKAIEEWQKKNAGKLVPIAFEIDSMSGAVTAAGEPAAFEQTVMGSPEYMCQWCCKEFLYVDSYRIFAELSSASCFCSKPCKEKYLAKNKRWPSVGAEILLGEPQLCTLGRTEEQILEAESKLVRTLLEEDRELVEAALGVDVPALVVGNDAFSFAVNTEQMDLLQRLFRLRRKLPAGFKIIRSGQ